MGRRKNCGKINVDSSHGLKILHFVKKLLKLTHTERADYLKTITDEEVKLISEIALNFINCNINYDTKSFDLLKRVKKFVYLLASKKTTITIKKTILKSLKGLSILNNLLPLVIKTFTL